MECVILYRAHNGRVGFISHGEEGEIAVFPNFDAAVDSAEKISLLGHVVYQIVELDEL